MNPKEFDARMSEIEELIALLAKKRAALKQEVGDDYMRYCAMRKWNKLNEEQKKDFLFALKIALTPDKEKEHE